MKISLVILTYNWPDALDRVLQSIATQRRMPEEVLIADDGSGQATTDVVARWQRDLPVPVRHVWQDDQGFRAARCRNLGIAASQGDYVILIDGDMLLHRDFVADHAAFAAPGHFLQGGRLKASVAESRRLLDGGRPVFAPWMDAEFDAFDGSRRLYAFRQPLLARWKARARNGGRVMSCNMSFWREDLLRANGFDERMEGYGAEDRELVARLENAGLRRRALKWAGLAVHLWHNSRAPEDVDDMDLPNNRLLHATRTQKITRCRHGIDTHPAASTGQRID
ncbi:glycosyltransferase family 2 protein [Stenotrophomonas mori]|uniref:Glycosyltransferase family 2 protein n=1 Tax=Stenotrophomonas mori TaxID=2871096 RepID=A0ABT0SKK0_9GAMM|nr:glycosyltransferase family 2 protein [Stenotrophomonas mori]MCL7715429.1 glycosyltransferase family 2 protein [Stenotrophomonas mori]